MTRNIRKFPCLTDLRKFAEECRGVAAVEFAIILPFMLSLYIGGVQLCDGLAMNIKVTNTTHVVADLVTQNTCVTSGTSGTLSSMLQASSATIAPYTVTPLTVTVSQVSTDATGKATVAWSQSLRGTARIVGQQITLPTSMIGQKSISLILGEVTYAYKPILGYAIIGTVNLHDSYYLFPRNSNSITYASTCP